MSDGDDFLTRWSRRKRASGQPAPTDDAQPSVKPVNMPDGTDTAVPAGTKAVVSASGVEPPPFDLSRLPSIDSIAADTDIRPFFLPGVPAELTRAALRRAWVADPMIRDYIGLAENSWDFNDPNAMPGFGPLEMTDELRRRVARIVGDLIDDRTPGETDRGSVEFDPPRDCPPAEPPVVEPPTSAETSRSLIDQSPDPVDHPQGITSLASAQTEIAAVQNGSSVSENVEPTRLPLPRRTHGGALPQ